MINFRSGFVITLIAVVGVFAKPIAADAAESTRQAAKASKNGLSVAASKANRKVAGKSGKALAAKSRVKAGPRLAAVPARPSFGQLAGLHRNHDALDLKSSVALVMDQDTREVLFSKNDSAVLPIASLTKLMTGLVVTEAKLPADQLITITQEDVDTEKGSRSRLKVGTELTRSELLHLALMSSENRAAHALGRSFPGGMDVFVAQMNAKALRCSMLAIAARHSRSICAISSRRMLIMNFSDQSGHPSMAR